MFNYFAESMLEGSHESFSEEKDIFILSLEDIFTNIFSEQDKSSEK